MVQKSREVEIVSENIRNSMSTPKCEYEYMTLWQQQKLIIAFPFNMIMLFLERTEITNQLPVVQLVEHGANNVKVADTEALHLPLLRNM